MRVLGTLHLVAAISLSLVRYGVAQDRPSAENLARMVDQLSRKRPTEVSFKRTNQPVDPACGLAQYDLTLTRGSTKYSFSVLSEPNSATPSPKNIFAIIKRLKVDADGSPRSYHAEDPAGSGTCGLVADKNGHYLPAGSQVCAIDQFSNGGITVFKGTTKVKDSLLKDDWLQFWFLIRDRKLASFDLAQVSGTNLGYQYYFFYWPQKDMTVFFKDENIRRTSKGYPCTRSAQSRFPGYFVSATTLKRADDDNGAETIPAKAVAPLECEAFRNINAESSPYFVIPGGTLAQATIGDIVAVQTETGGIHRIVYAVAADEGPISSFGEGSIALNQRLLGRPGPIMNNHDLNALDVDDGRTIAVLILGGTKQLLKGDYSSANVESVGRTAFERWSGSGADVTSRLKACITQAKVNPR